jgi:DNA-binding transcriptional regulator YiaG
MTGGRVAAAWRDGVYVLVTHDEHGSPATLISTVEIRRLREGYGLSQRAFARLLGWGEATLNRYENGSPPDAAHNDLLVALQDESTMVQFIERRRNRLTPADTRRLDATLADRLPLAAARALERAVVASVNLRPSIDRGNRLFTLDRFGQVAAYFAGRGGTFRTKLLKELWYADSLAFKRQALSLTGTPYIRLPMGPVPDQYEVLLRLIERDGFVTSEVEEIPQPDGTVAEGTRYTRATRFERELFTFEEFDSMEAVAGELGHLSGKALSELSHREPAWRDTAPFSVIPYTLTSQLSID